MHQNIKGASVLKNEDRDKHSIFKEVQNKSSKTPGPLDYDTTANI